MAVASRGSKSATVGGWSISVVGSDDEPLWSKRLHASERHARIDAWDVLLAFYEGQTNEERTTT
jgi:hypothetical protein